MTGSGIHRSHNARLAAFPNGANVALAEMDADPYLRYPGLREQEPVSWTLPSTCS